MIRIPELRVIIETEAHSGAWNMAVDESLLESAITDGVATLRWYEWNEPTVSLGYFQKSAELTGDLLLSRLPAVRRLSGGGAILHDDELTYSVAIPANQKLFERPEQLYDIVHDSIISSLCAMGFPVSLRGQTLKRPDEPLLCFLRQDSHDLTLRGNKILGSAQRRRRGAILQHGSLIRRASALAMHLPGLEDLGSVKVPEDLAKRLTVQVAKSLAEEWKLGVLSANEIGMTYRLCDQNRTDVGHRDFDPH
jgi:lipoyl(octanoyl) transferase